MQPATDKQVTKHANRISQRLTRRSLSGRVYLLGSNASCYGVMNYYRSAHYAAHCCNKQFHVGTDLTTNCLIKTMQTAKAPDFQSAGNTQLQTSR
jgi:long-subunit fatty acid transport protein